MKYGSACDAGLLSERRTVATAPTLPPPSEPTEAQIREALAAMRQARHWIRAVGWWAGFQYAGEQYPIEFLYPAQARQIALDYLARRPR
jgi:hypothetical protein